MLETRPIRPAMMRLRQLAPLAAALLATLAVASSAPADSTPPPPSTPPPVPVARFHSLFDLYFVRAGALAAAPRVIPKTRAVGTRALQLLLVGPTAAERKAGLTTATPRGARLRSVIRHGDLAIVDLSWSFGVGSDAAVGRRLAQVVYTITQFPGLKRVQFELGGTRVASLAGIPLDRPVGRARFKAYLPDVAIELPASGAAVSTPLAVKGMASGPILLILVGSDGALLAQRKLGTVGRRHACSVSLPFSVDADQLGRLLVLRANGGAELAVIRLTLEAG